MNVAYINVLDWYIHEATSTWPKFYLLLVFFSNLPRTFLGSCNPWKRGKMEYIDTTAPQGKPRAWFVTSESNLLAVQSISYSSVSAVWFCAYHVLNQICGLLHIITCSCVWPVGRRSWTPPTTGYASHTVYRRNLRNVRKPCSSRTALLNWRPHY